MGTFFRDLRVGLRSWAKSPGIALVVLVTLAIGIGANTALFSVVHGVLLQPFPFPEPDELVLVWETNVEAGIPLMFASPPNYADWARESSSLESIGVFTTRDATLEAEGFPERVRVTRVSSTLFPLLGVDPLEGRFFSPEEDTPGGPRSVIIGYGFWQRRFGGEAGIVGTSLVLDSERHTIVGIMPPAFQFPPPIALEGTVSTAATELWVPHAIDYASGQRGAHYLTALARRAPGVSLESAISEMNTIARRLADAYPDTQRGWDVTLVPLAEQVTGDVRPALLVLLGSVGLVLLIACGNVANLLLTRGIARVREMAIRASLGASRARLTRQLAAESLLLAAIGGALGAVLAFAGVELLKSMGPTNLPRLDEIRFDGVVLAFTFGVCLVAGLLFGLAPAFQLTAARLFDSLKDRDAPAATGRTRVIRNVLVVSEVALALLLLVSAGLLLQSFAHLRAVDPGFRESTFTMSTSLSRIRYAERQSRARVVEEMLQAIRALPDVEGAGSINEMPLADDRQGTIFYEEGELPERGREPRTNFSFVSPGYFRVMDVPLRRGRVFDDRDRPDSPRAVIVNRALAERYFPNENVIGKRLFVGFSMSEPWEVVGVVGNVRHNALGEEAAPNVYGAYLQHPGSYSVSFVLDTRSDPSAVTASVRRAIRSVDSSLPLFNVRSLSDVVDDSVSQPRFTSFLLGAFAAIAMLLAAVGIYGVMSYAVSQRIPEIGVRVAMGAQKSDVLRLILSGGARLAGVGLVIGTVLCLFATRFLSSLLFGIGAYHVPTFIAVAAVLLLVALAACYLPARRATRVDPIVALHYE